MTEYQPYGVRHFLRRLDPEGASELRRRPLQLRDGAFAAKGESVDLDRLRLDDVLVYRTLVVRRSPASSRPRAVRPGARGPLVRRLAASTPARARGRTPSARELRPGGRPCAVRRGATPGDTRNARGRPTPGVDRAAIDGGPLPAAWASAGGGCDKTCGAKPAALRFKLSAGSPVVVSLARRACAHGQKCTYRFAAKRTVKGRAGVAEDDGRAHRRRHEVAHGPLEDHPRRRAQPPLGALHRAPRPLTDAPRARRQDAGSSAEPGRRECLLPRSEGSRERIAGRPLGATRTHLGVRGAGERPIGLVGEGPQDVDIGLGWRAVRRAGDRPLQFAYATRASVSDRSGRGDDLSTSRARPRAYFGRADPARRTNSRRLRPRSTAASSTAIAAPTHRRPVAG